MEPIAGPRGNNSKKQDSISKAQNAIDRDDNQSRYRYLLNRKSKPVARLLSVSRELVHDTADEEEGFDVWAGVYSPVQTGDNGQDLPKERSQGDQIRQISKLQSFSGVGGGLRLKGASQDGQATEIPIDWASFYSDQNESVPRENFLSAPSTDWSTFSDDCPVTFTVTKPVSRDSYF